MKKIAVITLLCFALLCSCQRQPTNADGSSGNQKPPVGNQPPTTHLFLYPDSAGLDTSASVLTVHWWGDDPDGWVVGYYLHWDYFDQSLLADSIWLTSESQTFYLPLTSAYDEFTLSVRAVDNSAIWDYPAGVKVAQAEGGAGVVTAGMLNYFEIEAFLDLGSVPGEYDSGDILIWQGNITGLQTPIGAPLSPYPSDAIFQYQLPPTGLTGSLDAIGATLLFPVQNTPPEVDFRIETNPSLIAGETYQSFPTRSFFWEVSDLDGAETIDSCFYALDPNPGDTSWIGLPGAQTSVTLAGLTAGNHRFFLKVQDIAQAQSRTLSFPDTTDRFWQVIEPYGNVLIVDDYKLDATNTVLNFYRALFDTLPGVAGEYSVWEVGDALPYSTYDVLATLNYFDKVYWYSFYGFSHFPEALGSIASYLEGGGAMLISALQMDTTSSVIPVSEYASGLLRVGPPNGFVAVDTVNWQNLTLSSFFSNYTYGLAASERGEVLYEMGPGISWTPPPGICVRRTDNWKLIYFGVPLHLLNGSGTLGAFFERVFSVEF